MLLQKLQTEQPEVTSVTDGHIRVFIKGIRGQFCSPVALPPNKIGV
jgi:hypothetical protein